MTMTESAKQPKLPDAGLCPACAGEHARFYRPGAPADRPQIMSPEAAADLLVPLLQGLDREHAVTLNLDVKHRLIATTTVSIGSVDHTFMSPREVFRDANEPERSGVVVALYERGLVAEIPIHATFQEVLISDSGRFVVAYTRLENGGCGQRMAAESILSILDGTAPESVVNRAAIERWKERFWS